MVSDETPYAFAKRLRAEGRTDAEVLGALRALGLDAEEAHIAARASRGEAGVAPGIGAEADTSNDALPVPSADAPTHPCPQHAQWPVLTPCSRCGGFFCQACVRDARLKPGKTNGLCAACFAKEPPALVPIGGWLMLPALHLTLSTVVAACVLPLLFVLDQQKGNPAMVAINCIAAIAVGVWASLAFFRRKKSTPFRMLAFYGVSLAFTVIDAFSDGVSSLGKAPFTLGWMVYFLVSKRVDATFTVE